MTERARHGISYAFQQPVRFKGLTVRDLLEISAEQKLSRGQVCEYLGEVGLCAEEYVDRVVDASLSGGEGKRIEIATVLARKDAKIRVFDEPEGGYRSVEFFKSGTGISAPEAEKRGSASGDFTSGTDSGNR